MSFANILEEQLRPSIRCPENAVWNPARQRCQDRFSGEPIEPEPTYPNDMNSISSFFMVLLELTKLGSAMLGTTATDRGEDSGII